MVAHRPEQSTRLIADVEQELSMLLRRSRSASMQLARRVHPEMDAAGYALISQIELGTASGRTGPRASEVAQALGLDKSTVSRGLTQLESLGYANGTGSTGNHGVVVNGNNQGSVSYPVTGWDQWHQTSASIILSEGMEQHPVDQGCLVHRSGLPRDPVRPYGAWRTAPVLALVRAS